MALLADTSLDNILEQTMAVDATVLIIDSIQTMATADLPSAAGSVAQQYGTPLVSTNSTVSWAAGWYQGLSYCWVAIPASENRRSCNRLRQSCLAT